MDYCGRQAQANRRGSGGPCRIRTHVSGSESRKDIQTTLTVHAYDQHGRSVFNPPDDRPPQASIGSGGPLRGHTWIPPNRNHG